MTIGMPPRAAVTTPTPQALVAPAAPRQPIASELLFGGAREVQIVHGGAVYRLKKTSLGKLILTK